MRRSRRVETFLLVAVAAALASCSTTPEYRCLDTGGNWVDDELCEADEAGRYYQWVATSGGENVGSGYGSYGGSGGLHGRIGTHFGGFGGSSFSHSFGGG